MEIERKFIINEPLPDFRTYPSHKIIQAYINTNPVVRIRKSDDEYYLTYKGGGLMVRQEYNLPLNEESFEHLLKKADGNIISKTRYLIPLTAPSFTEDYSFSEKKELLIELDEFDAPFSPLLMAEVEFESQEDAVHFLPPAWFGEDVTMDPNYHNSNMSRRILP